MGCCTEHGPVRSGGTRTNESAPEVTLYKRHRRWASDGTWHALLTAILATQDGRGHIDWDIGVDSTIVRAH